MWFLHAILFFPALIGLFILFHIFRKQKKPADQSNRLNKIRLLWFCITREEMFVGLFPWLARDEKENMDANR